MFIMRNKFLVWLLILLISANFVQAQEKTDDDLKEFLQGSEFAIQRKVIKDGVVGQKGLAMEQEQETVGDLFSSEVVDPFNNQTVTTSVDYSELDDGIKDEELEEELDFDSIAELRSQIDILLVEAQKQSDFNPVDLLNSLKVDRIMTSPEKFVVIKGRKYSENDEIKIRFSSDESKIEFEATLDGLEVDTDTVEDQKIVEELKEDALTRYDEIVKSGKGTTEVIKISSIESKSVDFVINNKKYILKMKK